MLKKKVLLYGPYISAKVAKNAYGGGLGGYTRNMMAYMNNYTSKHIQIEPCFHTVRGQLKLDFFVWRFFVDLFIFLKSIVRSSPNAIHILGRYRTATPREFVICFLSKLMGIPILYEIKAGVFIEWYTSTNVVFRIMFNYIINSAAVVLVEGEPYLDFIKTNFGKEAFYFPNFVPSSEIPACNTLKLNGDRLKVFFVGYCYRGKGVFELVEGCILAALKGVKIELTLIGQEAPEFKEWLDNLSSNSNLTINRMGRQPHHVVLEHFVSNDIYCYPSKHDGEGHNNSINEAMMMGLIIITTKQGFLGSVLSNDRAYFLNEVSSKEVARVFSSINENKEEAVQRSINGFQYLKDHFSSEVAFCKLNQFYSVLLP